jgi:exonuclease SbcC
MIRRNKPPKQSLGLQSLKVENFQAHEKSKLIFAPGINIVAGTSDSGKSSLIRALQWVATNKPSGNDFVNWNTNKTVKVTVITSDGRTITRTRGKKENSYTLDKQIFKSFGKNKVPQEIMDALQLDLINFQRTNKEPFLIFSSPSEVAKVINDIVDLTIIDKSQSNARKALMRVQRQIKSEKEQLEERKENLKNLAWIDSAQEALSKLENKYAKLVKTRRRYDSIDITLLRLQEVQEGIEELKKLKPAKKLIDQLIQKQQALTETSRKVDQLSSLLGELKTINPDIILLKKENKRLKDKLPNICPLCGGQFKK